MKGVDVERGKSTCIKWRVERCIKVNGTGTGRLQIEKNCF